MKIGVVGQLDFRIYKLFIKKIMLEIRRKYDGNI